MIRTGRNRGRNGRGAFVRKSNAVSNAVALAAATTAAWVLATPALAGISFNSGISTVKFSHDADKSDSDPTAKTYTLTNVPNEGSIGSGFQFNKPISQSSSLSEATGAIGYIADSTAASFELKGGTGTAQNDPTNVWSGSSSLKLTIDMTYNVGSGGWGSTAAAQASLALAGQLGANGGYAQFIPNLRWYLGSGTGTPISDAWTTTRQWTNNSGSNSTFASTVSFFAPFDDPSYSNGQQIRLFGTVEFRSSNFTAPSQILPLFFEAGGGAPLRTFIPSANPTDFSDPKNWIDGNVPDGRGTDRAKFVNINFNPFGNPNQTVTRKTVTIDQPTALFGLDLDGVNGIDFVPIASPAGPTPRITFFGKNGLDGVVANPVLHIKNLQGDANHTFANGININTDPTRRLDLMVDSVPPSSPTAGAPPAVQFNGQISGEGGLRKLGKGSVALNFGSGQTFNDFTGGVVIDEGTLHANAFRSLGTNAVVVNGGVLNYNATDAAVAPVTIKAGGQLSLGTNVTVGGDQSFVLAQGGIIEGSTTQMNELMGRQQLSISMGSVIAPRNSDPITASKDLGVESRNHIYALRGNDTDSALAITVGDGTAGSFVPLWRGVGSVRGNFAMGGTLRVNGAGELFAPDGARLFIGGSLQQVTGGAAPTLTKRGLGTVVFASNSTGTVPYNGATTVEQGTLLVNGIHRGSIVVKPGAVLGGTNGTVGTLSSAVATVQKGGFLSPGSSVGTLNFSKLVLEGGSILPFELRTNPDGSIATGDRIVVTAINGLTVPLAGSDPALIDISDPLFNPVAGMYPLIDYNCSFNGSMLGLALAGFPTDEFNFNLVNNAADTMIYLQVTPADSPQWKINGGGLWTNAENWIGDVPGLGFGDEANFRGKLTSNAPAEVFLDGTKTVGVIEFDANVNAGGDSYVLRQTNAADAIVFDNGLSPGAIDVSKGRHSIDAPVTFVSNGMVETAAGSELTLARTVTVNAARTLTKTGAGTLHINAMTDLSAGSTLAVSGGLITTSDAITGGTVTIQQATLDAMRLNDTVVQVNAGGVGRVLPNGTPAATSLLRDLNVAQDSKTLALVGQFDLTDNNAILRGESATAAGQFDKARTYLASGFAGGDWNGMGINSSAAANDPLGITGVAARRNVKADGTRWVEEFDGQPVTEHDTLLMYTYYGDTNFSGLVDVDDYHRIDQGFLKRLSGWENGDVNYSNAIDLDDYALIDAAYLGQGGSLAALAAAAVTSAAVPEPTAALLAMPAMMFLRRRRTA